MSNRTEYGYGRAFNSEQNGLSQMEILKNAGISVENIFCDLPGKKASFQQMKACLNPGDVVVVKNLYQLGYTYREIFNSLTEIVKKRVAHIRVLDMPLLDTTLSNKKLKKSFITDFFLQIISDVAEQEHVYIRRRQAEGIALARAQGKHLGRPRIPKPEKFDEMYNEWRSGKITAEEMMKQLDLRRSTFGRLVKEKKAESSRQVS